MTCRFHIFSTAGAAKHYWKIRSEGFRELMTKHRWGFRGAYGFFSFLTGSRKRSCWGKNPPGIQGANSCLGRGGVRWGQ